MQFLFPRRNISIACIAITVFRQLYIIFPLFISAFLKIGEIVCVSVFTFISRNKSKSLNPPLISLCINNVGISFIPCGRKEMTKKKLCIASKWLIKFGHRIWDTTNIVRKTEENRNNIQKHNSWSMICYRGERAQFLQLNKQEKVVKRKR